MVTRFLLALLTAMSSAFAGQALTYQILDRYPGKRSEPTTPFVIARDGRPYAGFDQRKGESVLGRLTGPRKVDFVSDISGNKGFTVSGLVGGHDGAIFGDHFFLDSIMEGVKTGNGTGAGAFASQ